MPIFVIPIVSSFLAAGFMLWVIGTPIAALTEALKNMLQSLSGGAMVVYAAVHGSMAAFDLGGPVNKAAWAFGMAMMEQGWYVPNTMQAIGSAVPPLAMALAVLLGRNRYNETEQKAGIPSFLMWMVGITEGAIPFAANDPIRVIPSLMLGSAVGCVIGYLTNVEVRIPWDSLPTIPGTSNVFMYLVSIVVGALVAAFTVNFLKRPVSPD
jgi:fructose-specific phosphotransferase system IIC component